MNSPAHSKHLKTKHKSKIKRNWIYDPETGEEQESFIPLDKSKIKSKEFIGDLFNYEEEEIR
jgi:hypothetical protein